MFGKTKRGKKKGQATHIAPLNLVPLLASAPGGVKGAGRIRLTPHKSRNFFDCTAIILCDWNKNFDFKRMLKFINSTISYS